MRQKQNSMRGFTLVELIMTIMIAAIIIPVTATVIVETLTKTHYPESLSKASALLKRELDRVENLGFSGVVAEGPVNYLGNFSDYAYEVSFDYVDGSDLNTPAGSPTDYKRITITISQPDFRDVSAVTLVTDY